MLENTQIITAGNIVTLAFEEKEKSPLGWTSLIYDQTISFLIGNIASSEEQIKEENIIHQEIYIYPLQPVFTICDYPHIKIKYIKIWHEVNATSKLTTLDKKEAYFEGFKDTPDCNTSDLGVYISSLKITNILGEIIQ